MKILLTNDDGVYSAGIHVLAKSLSDAGNEVLIVAPDRERSGCGHAMTMDRPVSLKDVDEVFITGNYKAKACDAFPTDCVILAYDVLKFRPDYLISGINNGPNVADDLTYSGTVCAAMEGIIIGVPSIAVSLVPGSKDKELYNCTASSVSLALLDWFNINGISKKVLYNVNIPNLPLDELKGFKMTRKGIRRYEDKVTVINRPYGKKAYWIGGRIEDDDNIGTDVWALNKGYISITPIHMEMTDFEELDKSKKNKMCSSLKEFIKTTKISRKYLEAK
jgi:5'-nucleotidase